jgi:hypothetical protein
MIFDDGASDTTRFFQCSRDIEERELCLMDCVLESFVKTEFPPEPLAQQCFSIEEIAALWQTEKAEQVTESQSGEQPSLSEPKTPPRHQKRSTARAEFRQNSNGVAKPRRLLLTKASVQKAVHLNAAVKPANVPLSVFREAIIDARVAKSRLLSAGKL